MSNHKTRHKQQSHNSQCNETFISMQRLYKKKIAAFEYVYKKPQKQSKKIALKPKTGTKCAVYIFHDAVINSRAPKR